MGSIWTGSIRSTARGGWSPANRYDRDNFTALLKELRAAVGNKKLVTIAVGANAESPKSWVDVKAIAPSLDYINLMTYDLAYGTQYFNSNLYDSTRWYRRSPKRISTARTL
ncbi:glycosyl hydrolase family 18 protein [Klebsiella michiganensis]|nr:glycosyl hydrolase family 18 protein [Klebsiella michiganensis]